MSPGRLRDFRCEDDRAFDSLERAAAEDRGRAGRILGHLVGYYGVEVGGLNQVVHLWAYDSLDDRAKRRAELWADKDLEVFGEQFWRPYIHVRDAARGSGK